MLVSQCINIISFRYTPLARRGSADDDGTKTDIFYQSFTDKSNRKNSKKQNNLHCLALPPT